MRPFRRSTSRSSLVGGRSKSESPKRQMCTRDSIERRIPGTIFWSSPTRFARQDVSSGQSARNSTVPSSTQKNKLPKKCRKFPNCLYGNKCLYIHPRVGSSFSDNKDTNSQSSNVSSASSARTSTVVSSIKTWATSTTTPLEEESGSSRTSSRDRTMDYQLNFLN